MNKSGGTRDRRCRKNAAVRNDAPESVDSLPTYRHENSKSKATWRSRTRTVMQMSRVSGITCVDWSVAPVPPMSFPRASRCPPRCSHGAFRCQMTLTTPPVERRINATGHARRALSTERRCDDGPRITSVTICEPIARSQWAINGAARRRGSTPLRYFYARFPFPGRTRRTRNSTTHEQARSELDGESDYVADVANFTRPCEMQNFCTARDTRIRIWTCVNSNRVMHDRQIEIVPCR